MADTNELLKLIDEFPFAFREPDFRKPATEITVDVDSEVVEEIPEVAQESPGLPGKLGGAHRMLEAIAGDAQKLDTVYQVLMAFALSQPGEIPSQPANSQEFTLELPEDETYEYKGGGCRGGKCE